MFQNNFKIQSIDNARAIEMINERHALNELKPEDVFIFGMSLSNQTVDSYRTRMSDSSINNYVVDFNEGRALYAVHDDQRFPVGRIFYAEKTGVPLNRNARYEDTSGLTLNTYAYIQRNLTIDGNNTNDVIRAIEGGTIKDVSIGFDVNVNEGDVRCSICGKDALSTECRHIPGNKYKEDRCYAWIDNARAVEGSLVGTGATPGAQIFEVLRSRKNERNNLMLWDVFKRKIEEVNPDFTSRFKEDDEDHTDGLIQLLVETRSEIANKEVEIVALKERAKIAEDYLNSLVEDALKARVRAFGQDTFDEEKYKTFLLRSADVGFIKSEIKNFTDVAEKALAPMNKEKQRQIKVNTNLYK